MMHQYWPTMLDNPEASEHVRRHATWIQEVEKLVCSNRLSEVTWKNASLLQGDCLEEIRWVKEAEGGDIVVLESPRLAQTLLQAGLVDRLRLPISPVVVGGGFALFDQVAGRIELIEAETMSTGALGLTYRVLPSESVY
ncbi:TPA: dihydrofolate reductase family protein [Streptococcus suis]|nr:dihydrofolate reductase family protein [Streptococcus suis]